MNTLLAVMMIAGSLCAAQQQAQSHPLQTQKVQPGGMQQDKHLQGVNEHGDKVMGFSHEKTTHHFRLYSDGGAIEVEANSAEDTSSRDMIREHLGHIARMFAAGDFNAPMLIHGVNPPGTDVMTRLRQQIEYAFSGTPRGGRVRIVTQNADALEAVHQFLRFQIRDHKTSDSLGVAKAP